ncbi:DUF3794 and LysM peptidoglycan-binding domain-containing protein [Clostridium rectalis]|uniref:DUF3794 and LysM peptidoglycan-binding domain-containing protein n=1 Tax=Clostridium rectalis TaxID=2040295 RepID=UPI000F639C23|nr:SPOCS domain-containing protein [Clostridium rectalis]
MAIELVKENIECEQLLGENSSDTVVKAEYVIPDTHPDVFKVLSVDAKPYIINKEIIQDKVYLEGQVEYNIIYMAKEEEEALGVYNTTYTGNFSNYVEVRGAEHNMDCEAECYVEHMECNIANERKIAVEGVINSKAEVYKKYDFEMVRDIESSDDIQMLKNPMEIDKIIGSIDADMTARGTMEVSSDKPEIGNILKCDINIHKKDVNIMEDKVDIQAAVLIDVLYRGKDSNEVVSLQGDVAINKEVEFQGVNPEMEGYTDFRVASSEFNIKQDDLGENRIIDVDALIKANTKVMHKEEMDIIEDAYSPSVFMDMKKQNYELNVIHGQAKCETVVKGDIELDNGLPKATEVIFCSGKVCITDRRIVEDKVLVDAVLGVDVMYRTKDQENYIGSVNEEIPFSCTVEMPGCKIDMQSIAKAFLESLDATVEAEDIAIKAVVDVYSRVNYITNKEFLVNMEPVEGELPEKKASIIIYVVQNGDTLWKIAKKYNTTIDKLVKINNIENPDSIKPGEKLIIPGRACL